MSKLVLWQDVPSALRQTWRRGPGPCAAAIPNGWGDGTYAPCYGYVRPGRQFCWSHDPEIETPERRAATALKVSEGRRRVRSVAMQVANWVGEAGIV